MFYLRLIEDNYVRYLTEAQYLTSGDIEAMIFNVAICNPEKGAWKKFKGILDINSPITIGWTADQAEEIGLVTPDVNDDRNHSYYAETITCWNESMNFKVFYPKFRFRCAVPVYEEGQKQDIRMYEKGLDLMYIINQEDGPITFNPENEVILGEGFLSDIGIKLMGKVKGPRTLEVRVPPERALHKWDIGSGMDKTL